MISANSNFEINWYKVGGFLVPLLTYSLLACAGLIALPSHAQPAHAPKGGVESMVQPAASDSSPFKARNLVPTSTRRVRLDAVPEARISTERQTASRPGVPHKIGFGREVAPLRTPAKTADLLEWTDSPAGGKIAAVSVTSPGAVGIRLGVLVKRLPAQAILRFYPQGAGAAYEISGAQLMQILERNLAAGDRTEQARTFWSPDTESEEVTLEIELPPGVAPELVEVAIPRVSHLFDSPVGRSIAKQRSGGCDVDASCHAEWLQESKATARITLVEGGATYLCTGTLLNDASSSATPYFLTANHCISSQTVASTLESYWFYHSTGCNSAVLNPGYERKPGGATLLYSTAATDTAFMLLNQAPPSGAVYAGWLPDAPTPGTALSVLHHPGGRMQSITSGTVSGYKECQSTFGDFFSCTNTSTASGQFLDVAYSLGVTEGGSSGAGAFVASGGRHYLVGQLYGGTSSCANPNGKDTYGRFDLPYKAALHNWLDGGSKFALSVSKSGDGDGMVSSSPAGISCGTTCSVPFAAGSSVTLTATADSASTCTGWGGACSGSAPFCAVSMDAAKSVTVNFTGTPLGVALDNPGLAWSTDGDAPFTARADTFHFGGSSARTGSISHWQTSRLSVTVTGPGTLSWYWRISSEADYDFFTVYLDGVSQVRWSGEQAWKAESLSIPAGSHTVVWEYAKDGSVSMGQDAGWVDEVRFAGASKEMLVHLEEPIAGSTASGIANIRGWAVSGRPVTRVDLYLDGHLLSTLPYGGTRPDVGAAYPEYSSAGNSGFSMAYNFGNLSTGRHTFVARAVDDTGSHRDSIADFDVVRFPTAFISNPGEVSLLGTSLTVLDGNTFRLNNVVVQNRGYDVTMRWNTAAQAFSIVAVSDAGRAASTARPAHAAGAARAAGDMLIHLEEPAAASNASGVANIRGWAIAPRPIVRVDLYLDGSFLSSVPYGGTRPDVGSAYPGYPNSGQSGFSMAFNFGNLSAGSHTLVARAVDAAGNTIEASAAFNVVRFPSSFVANPADVSVLGATLTVVDANTLRLNNVVVQNANYSLILRWNTATQGFSLVGIQ